MLRQGLILLGVTVGILLLFTLLNYVGIAQFGPCGPDGIGLILLGGFLLTGGVGALFTLFGFLMYIADRFHSKSNSAEDVQ